MNKIRFSACIYNSVGFYAGGKKRKELVNHFKHEHMKIPIKMETEEHTARKIK